MSILDIRHSTTYRYRQAVGLHRHRLMLRPRATHDLRLLTTALTCTPAAKISWTYDIFGNSIAWADFTEPSATLTIESRLELELYTTAWPVFQIAPSAHSYPFAYSDDERADLGAMLAPQYPDSDGTLKRWAKAFVAGSTTDTLSLLKDINASVTGWIAYLARDDEGTQTPLESLKLGTGSCRDIALLMAEAVRHLGFGARIISGYLFVPPAEAGWSSTSGTTHAWLEIYLPGAGWISFDPTNRSMGGANLIPVACVRDISQAVPISGSFFGAATDLLGMDVSVTVNKIS
ncbi:MAG: transglutaminase family protein [Rhizomicrobium sp.]|nr:transglutaminase family protein [Rhizomicrobium sp.]